MDSQVIVVGGGLAGLAAAALVARQGATVTVLEGGKAVGGRARTQERDGFLFNQGAHALYVGGHAGRILGKLGVPWSGGDPTRAGSSWAWAGGTLHPLPVDAASTMRTSLFGFRDRVELGRLLMSLPFLRPGRYGDTSWAQWLDARVDRPMVRAHLEALVRLATYGGEPDRMGADVALGQLMLAARAGVRYLDGGWQTLVDGAYAAARGAGVRVELGATVERVVPGAEGVTVVRGDGREDGAQAVILAVAPGAASGMLPRGALDVRNLRPVRAACLDVAFDGPIHEGRSFGLGIDVPYYASMHSGVARLAPEGGALMHAAKYLGTGEGDPAGDRADIEAFVDQIFPGWRGRVRDARFLPAMVVHHALPQAATGGLAGRPDVAVAGAPGVFVAGDWVDDRGLLLDAALASAEVAAQGAVGALRSAAAA
jgi:phytoene dehydrogenase-like protein